MIHQLRLFITALYDATAIVTGTVVYHGMLLLLMVAGLCIAMSAIPVTHGQDPHAEEIGALKAQQTDSNRRLNDHDRRLALVETAATEIRSDVNALKADMAGLKDMGMKLFAAIVTFLLAILGKGLHWMYVTMRRVGQLPDRRTK